MFLRGDEAPTGIDPATGTSYTGQNGVQVNGTLTLTEGSVLAAYGGGRNATTSNGGSGTISAANVFAKGGSSYFPKAGSTGGQALAQGVTLAGTSNRSLTDGALRHGGSRLCPGRAGRRLSQNRGCFPRRGLERADAAVRRRAVPGPAQGKAELTPSRQTIPSAGPRTPTRCTRLTPIKSTAPAAFGKNCRAAGAVPFSFCCLLVQFLRLAVLAQPCPVQAHRAEHNRGDGHRDPDDAQDQPGETECGTTHFVFHCCCLLGALRPRAAPFLLLMRAPCFFSKRPQLVFSIPQPGRLFHHSGRFCPLTFS